MTKQYTNTIKLTVTESAKGNVFLVIDSGRRTCPWMTVDEAQAVLDNIPAVQQFVTTQRAKAKTVTPPAAAGPANVIDLQATVAAAVAAALKAAGVTAPTTTTPAPEPAAPAPAPVTPAPVLPAPKTPAAGKTNGTVRPGRFSSLK